MKFLASTLCIRSGADLLRQVSGIKVKQNGGFGSKSDFFFKGSTGKQIKFFIDGLPQDNMGETKLLNIYTVEQTERIEVYKGVFPLWLGADALGASVNIVTRKEREDYYDASCTVGSFNTHKINLAEKKYFAGHFCGYTSKCQLYGQQLSHRRGGVY